LKDKVAMNITENLEKAKELLEEADAIFITAGAGMGVDRVQIFLGKMDIMKSPYMCVS